MLEPSLKNVSKGDTFQFERLGYFCADSRNHAPEKPVFNREDILLVCEQANVNENQAISALTESNGDLARAILLLTTK